MRYTATLPGCVVKLGNEARLILNSSFKVTKQLDEGKFCFFLSELRQAQLFLLHFRDTAAAIKFITAISLQRQHRWTSIWTILFGGKNFEILLIEKWPSLGGS
jgi:hypothetical protein